MIDLRHVETFHCIVRLGSFSAAAKFLHTTQPAVSARVRALEQELGVKLFSTNSRRTALTEKGSQFVVHAERMLSVVRDAAVQMSNAEGAPARVRVGAVETIAVTWLEAFVETARTALPNVVLEIDVSLTGELWRRYRGGLLDMIIVPVPVLDTRLTYVPLGRIRYAWMASAGLGLSERSVNPPELTRYPLIGLSADSSLFHMAEAWFGAHNVVPRWTSFCTSMSVVASLTRAGSGISLLPDDLRGSRIDIDELRRLDVVGGDFAADFFVVLDTVSPTPVLSQLASIAQRESTFSRG